jgi:ABC-2 type transport system ATP-binding protein
MAEIALSVRALAKRYEAVQAVREVSFDVAAGEIFGLIGPNGAGKSTTLECILGLCEPDAGSIFVRGIDVRGSPAEAKSILGAQLQQSGLPDAMTPRQALTLCASFYRHPAQPKDLLERFLLGEKADARYSTLSGGLRQRLALAMAFINEPEVVILDEPTAGLDPPARRELHRLISDQRAAGRTIVFSTHYLEEARTLCDRIALINRGALVAVDTPQALIARTKASARIEVRTDPPLGEADIRGLPGATRISFELGGWSIDVLEVNRGVTALTALIEARGLALQDVSIHRPTLDDAFLELTGADSD